MNWNNYLLPKRLRPSTRNVESDPRNEFESDFGRVLFSPALRRMHDKTQVFPLTSDDNIHSRLTHSLEVMSVGHSLGLRVVEDSDLQRKIGMSELELTRSIPVVLKNACLVHDIGNPPFGHFGETVIQGFFEKYFKKENQVISLSDVEKQDFTSFDGNAQGFRVLTKLQVLNDPYGLNLTYGTLAAYLKYPNPGAINKDILAQSKRGVFQSEIPYLKRIAEECTLIKEGAYKRHPLSFLMEAADSICYLVMDIEDGYNKKYYSYDKLKAFLLSIEGLAPQIEYLENKYKGRGEEIARIVNLRIYLIKHLAELAFQNFKNNFEAICQGEYHFELIEEDPSGVSEKLMEFCVSNIFPHREVRSLELTGHSVLKGLLEYFTEFIIEGNDKYVKRGLSLISESIIRAALLENELPEDQSFKNLPDYYKLRIIVDYITGMTDQYAVDQFQKLSGQKIV
jgi:dGTPase